MDVETKRASWSVLLRAGPEPLASLTIEFHVEFERQHAISWGLVLSYTGCPSQVVELCDLPVDEAVPICVRYPDGVSVRGSISCCAILYRGCFFETSQLVHGAPEAIEYLLGTLAIVRRDHDTTE